VLCTKRKYLAIIKETVLGASDKIQLTDAIAKLIQQEQIGALYMTGKSRH
jgi:UTP-glucose-1-phosphate uridylyltransferase